MPIFRVKSVKIYTGQKNLHWRRQPRQRQLSGMVICLLDNGLWYKFCVSWIVFSDMCSVSLGQCSVFCASWTAWESRDPLRVYYTSTTAKTTPITFHYAWHCRPHAWLSFTFENHKSTISIDRSLDWMKFVRICDTVWSNRTGIK